MLEAVIILKNSKVILSASILYPLIQSEVQLTYRYCSFENILPSNRNIGSLSDDLCLIPFHLLAPPN